MSQNIFEPQDCGPGGGTGVAGQDVEQQILCDFNAEGEVVGSAIAVYQYDETGAAVGPPTYVDPTTGNPYVAQGTLRPCETGDCAAPQQFCFTTTSTGPVDHPGRQYDLTLPINPGFAVDSLQVDDVSHAANLTWSIFDSDGEDFREDLEQFIQGRVPAGADVTVTNPNAGTTVCGLAQPMTIHIECVRLDQDPPDLIELVYNGGRDLVVNPAYNTTPETDLSQFQFYYLRRQDQGGTIDCTGTANRGWETNDLGDGNRDFEIWGTGPGGLAAQSNTTPTPRGTPVQEITADINDTGDGPTIWQTFEVPAAGNFRVQLVHGARDPGETHTIRLSTGDTNDTGTGDIINDVTQPPSVTNSGGPNPWTTLDQTVPLGAGEYTFSFQTTNPVGAQRGGLFTDMRVYQDVPNQRATATTDDDTCVVTVDESTTVQDAQWWAPRCANGTIISWRNVETGEELDNASFWGQAPAPNRCSDAAGTGGGGSVAANLVHSYPICTEIGGVATTLQRVVITDGSGGVLADSFIGPDGGPVATPADYVIGTCADTAFVNDEILCDDNGPFLRKYLQSVVNGQGRVNSFRDFTLAGTVYAPVGTVRICEIPADRTLGAACYLRDDTPTIPRQGFLALDQSGVPVLYSQTGVVEPEGTYTITICAEFTQQSHILCDFGNLDGPDGEPHQFLAWYTDSPVDGFEDLQRTLELDGATAYVPVGPVGVCATGSGGTAGDDVEIMEHILCDGLRVSFVRRRTFVNGVLTDSVDVEQDGVTPYAPFEPVGVCPPVESDREGICYTLDATGEVILTGWARHDDSIPDTPQTPNGIAFFTNLGVPIDPTAGGFNQVPCGQGECCPQELGEGCWSDGTNSGRWRSYLNPDATVTVVDQITGDPVLPADVVPCTEASQDQSHLVNLPASSNFAIPTANLVGWSVRALSAPVTIQTNGDTPVDLVNGEVVSSYPEDGKSLADAIVVGTQAGGQAHIIYLTAQA